MRTRLTYLATLIVLLSFCCSCDQEESPEPELSAKLYKIAELDGRDRGDCFEFVYPVGFTMPDGSNFILYSEHETDRLREWYAQNPGINERPQFQYPLAIIARNGVPQEIPDEPSLRRVYEECANIGSGPGDCFELVYPVVYVMPDGSLIPVEYEEAAEGEFGRWYRENPEIDDPPILQHPVKVILEDGSEKTINNNAEMRELVESCD
jgi:hypothetical protein